ncbi:MAG TPA: hypothetical protein VF543_10115 [Pyrinomonadaceae bacterium]|jgi:hypothetical protein
MKDDYLWDKSGEPDPEIEQLENLLGGLRSRRTAKDLMPAVEKLSRKGARTFPKWLSVAAAVAFVLLALGVFNVIQRQSVKQFSDSQFVMLNPTSPEPPVEVAAPAGGSGETSQPESEKPLAAAAQNEKRTSLETRRRNIARKREAFLNRQEQTEGLMAKEQLLKALQITSSNLDIVQKQVQGDEKQGPSS